MRVVHVVWSLDGRTGGLARAVALVATTHARSGLETVVVTTGTVDLDLPPEITVHAFPRDRWGARFAGSRGLRRWLRAELGPDDVVHLHAVWDLASVTGARAARRAGSRVVLSPHGSLEPFDLRKHARAKRVLGRLFVRRVLQGATVHCTTEREASCLVTYGARPAVRVLPLPLGEVSPTVPGHDPVAARTWLGAAPGVPLLLFLGRVDYKKGLSHLLGALERMTTPAHLAIAGTGDPDYEKRIRSLVTELGLGDRVTWTGWLDGPAKAEALRAADLFVLLSDAENYGIAVVEAMQHDAVVVASAEVGAADDLARYDAVLLCPREAGPAAEHLDRYLADPALRERTAAAASQVLQDVLSPEVLDRRYRDLADGGASQVGRRPRAAPST